MQKKKPSGAKKLLPIEYISDIELNYGEAQG
jgi:hypothetical protein